MAPCAASAAEGPSVNPVERERRRCRTGYCSREVVMMRLIYLLALAAALLTACAMSPTSPDSFYRCDRNGEREQRVACEP